MWSLKWQCMCSTLLQQEAGVDWLSNPSLILKSNGWFKKEKKLLEEFVHCLYFWENRISSVKQAEKAGSNVLGVRTELDYGDWYVLHLWKNRWTGNTFSPCCRFLSCLRLELGFFFHLFHQGKNKTKASLVSPPLVSLVPHSTVSPLPSAPPCCPQSWQVCYFSLPWRSSPVWGACSVSWQTCLH